MVVVLVVVVVMVVEVVVVREGERGEGEGIKCSLSFALRGVSSPLFMAGRCDMTRCHRLNNELGQNSKLDALSSQRLHL